MASFQPDCSQTPRGRNSARTGLPRQERGESMSANWTPADAAELDVLLYELVDDYQEHRQKCEACKPEPCKVLTSYLEHKADCWKCQNGVCVATDHYGEACWIRTHWLAHTDGCKRCNPCPHL